MGQRPATQPSEPENDQPRVGHGAMHCGKFGLGRGGQYADGRLCYPRQGGGDVERAVGLLDQLHTQGKAHFAHSAPHRVEQALVILARFGARQPRCDLANTARQIERGHVNQRIEQIGAPRQIVGQARRMRQHAHHHVEQRRARLEQVEHVDGRRQLFDQLFPAQQRTVRIGRGGQRAQQCPPDAGKRLARGFAAQGAEFAVAPAFDARRQRFGIRDTQLSQFASQRLVRHRDAATRGPRRNQRIEPRADGFGDLCHFLH